MAITFTPPEEATPAAPATPDATPQPTEQTAKPKGGIRFDPPPDVAAPAASGQPSASAQPAAKGGIRFDPPKDMAPPVPRETTATPRFAPANPTPTGAQDYGAANRLAEEQAGAGHTVRFQALRGYLARSPTPADYDGLFNFWESPATGLPSICIA